MNPKIRTQIRAGITKWIDGFDQAGLKPRPSAG